MKITLEFDTDSENFDYHELERIKQAGDMAICISEILNKLRGWEKYDSRENIPVDEITDTLREAIVENVNIEKMGY